jgi:GTP cyclohydrolase I
MTMQIAEQLLKITEADGIAVQVDAEHHCVACRGVMDTSSMVTSVMLGKFREEHSMKSEFMSIVSDMKRRVI